MKPGLTHSPHYRALFQSYQDAAWALGIDDDELDMLLRRATRFERSCPSCRFSRARANVLEIATTEGRLAIYERQCSLDPLNRKCLRWRHIDLPMPVLKPAA